MSEIRAQDGARWQALLADVSGELQAEAEAELRAEVADRSRVEQSRLRVIDRLRPLLDAPHRVVRVGIVGHGATAGRLCALGSDWMVLSADTGEWLVSLGAVEWLRDLPPESAEPGWEGVVGARLAFRVALRRVLRDRSVVTVGTTAGGAIAGRLDRVAYDHIELGAADARRGGTYGTRTETGGVMIPLAAVAFLRRG